MVNLELNMNGQVVAKLEIDADLLSRLLQAASAVPAPRAAAPARSAALTTAQASEVLRRLDAKGAAFLSRLAENHGALTWGETKSHFSVKNFDDFSDGPGKDVEKAARHVLHDKSAKLIWRDEHEWVGLEKGEDEACQLYVDGPALTALREATAEKA